MHVGGQVGPVDAFCWLQFEHSARTLDLGGLSFIYDTKAFADYRATTTDTGSDGAAIARLLATITWRFRCAPLACGCSTCRHPIAAPSS